MKKKTSEIVFLNSAQVEAEIHSQDNEVLSAIATSAFLTEDLALTLLKRRNLHQSALAELAKNGRLMKGRKVRAAVVLHPKTPRHVSLPLMRHLYTFELMQLSLTPAIPPDVKVALEEVVIGRLNTLSAGERLTLAKRSSAKVAMMLLNADDKRIVSAGLNNPYLTEPDVIKALAVSKPSSLLAPDVCHHPKWSVRKDVQAALLRNEFTPLAAAIQCAHSFDAGTLGELLHRSRLPEKIKVYLLETANKRSKRH